MKKRTSALLLALVMLFSLMAPMANAEEIVTAEAVYLGVKDYGLKNNDDESTFEHRFFINGEEAVYKVDGADNYALQNELMEGYIYDIAVTDGVVTDVELQDKGTITMGTVEAIGEGTITVDGQTVTVGDAPVYEIKTPVGGASVEPAKIAVGDTVKVTEKAIYKAFVAEEYTAPVSGTPGKKTLKNLLATALEPVGTTLYVYGGSWDWQDDKSSNQSMHIGLSQSWIDFFQSQDSSYYYGQNDDDPGKSYYSSDRGWNQYYYAGVDCSGYMGWILYNTMNTEDCTVAKQENGFVGSARGQAKMLADKGWGTFTNNQEEVRSTFKTGDVFSMSGHVWICLGVCDDGSIVFMHSTPSGAKDGSGGEGGGAQISALDPKGSKDCEAYQLASYYMKKYYPQWSERYDAVLRDYESYTATDPNGNGTRPNIGKFSWSLGETGLLTDPDGYATMTPAEILGDLFHDDFRPALKREAVYIGVKDYATADGSNKDNFKYRFFVDGQEKIFTIKNDDVYSIQNQLQNGYIYNIVTEGTVVTDVELLDKGSDKVVMGTVTAIGEGTITVGGEEIAVDGLPVWEIESPTPASGAVITASELAVGDTVKVTKNAVYKAFIAEDYTAPVNGTPGQTTLRNFLETALTPVGTALYVYGGSWDWQDDVSSNQAMTIGIPQSWIDFFQSQDASYTYSAKDETGEDDLANSYYWRGYNEYYWAGVDCSAYVGWVIYNTMNTKSATVSESKGYVGSATGQAKRFAGEGWGTMDMGEVLMDETTGKPWVDEDGDGRRVYNNSEFKVGDIFSMNGHVWICLGTCEDGSIVFTHSTPSENDGAGIQISAIGPNKECEAYKLASYYMEKFYPQWGERYDALLKSFDSYTKVYYNTAGKFSWTLDGTGALTDPDGFADMKPAQILAYIFGEENLVQTHQAVYVGVNDYANAKGSNKNNFMYRFNIDGVESLFTIENDDVYSIQNQLQHGYIYNITTTNGVITDVELLDKGHENVVMGTVNSITQKAITIDGTEYAIAEGAKTWKIESPTPASGAVVTAGEAAKKDTVKVILNDKGEAASIYVAFVAEKYTAPVNGTPGEKTLKNFIETALTPVGTALYVYGGSWDWQDDVSSNQAMTIGIPQSWIDFFQSQDASYTYSAKDETGEDDLANSYYWRGYNEYYWAGVDCSAYVGWVIYNTMNTKSATVSESKGYVGSATGQAKRFAGEGWGTMDMGEVLMDETTGKPWVDEDGDGRRVYNNSEFKVGDIFSMNGHVWICLGTCEDGSIVFTHSTPSENDGAGIQISAIGPNKECEAYKLASYYMEKFYPQWGERYDALLKSFDSYTKVYYNTAGKFSWTLDGTGALTDPDGFADMKPAQILSQVFDDKGPAAPGDSASRPSVNTGADKSEPEVSKPTYTDVPATHWAYEAVEAVTKAGLFNGTSATTFSPEMDTTRGQLMTVLARLSGADTSGDAIAKGVAWAVANGVSDGTNPGEKITREQLVTMLYRYSGKPAVTGDLSAYTDAASVSDWAKDAMTWAVNNGIVKGMTETTLVPGAYATRAQIATIMQRFSGL